MVIYQAIFDIFGVRFINTRAILDKFANIPIGTRKLEYANVKGYKVALNGIVPHVSERELELRGSSIKEIVVSFPLRINVHARTHDDAQDEEQQDHDLENLSICDESIPKLDIRIIELLSQQGQLGLYRFTLCLGVHATFLLY